MGPTVASQSLRLDSATPGELGLQPTRHRPLGGGLSSPQTPYHSPGRKDKSFIPVFERKGEGDRRAGRTGRIRAKGREPDPPLFSTFRPIFAREVGWDRGETRFIATSLPILLPPPQAEIARNRQNRQNALRWIVGPLLPKELTPTLLYQPLWTHYTDTPTD